MKHSAAFLFVALSPTLAFTSASAEIFNCNGTWTNQPCEDGGAPAFKEQTSEADPKKAEQSRRELMLHDLDMLRIRLRREHNLTYSIDDVKAICQSTSSTATECSQAVAARQSELNQALVQKQRVDVEKDRNEIQKSEVEKEQPTVTIINEETNIIIPRRRRPPILDYPRTGNQFPLHPQPPLNPGYQHPQPPRSEGAASSRSRAVGGVLLPLNTGKATNRSSE